MAYIATIGTWRIAFFDDNPWKEPSSGEKFFEFIDSVIDVTFGVDILVNFFSPYDRIDGSLEYNLKRIAFNYLTGFFPIDLVASIPYKYIMSDVKVSNPN